MAKAADCKSAIAGSTPADASVFYGVKVFALTPFFFSAPKTAPTACISFAGARFWHLDGLMISNCRSKGNSMKKFWHDPKYKEYMKKHAKRSLKKRTRMRSTRSDASYHSASSSQRRSPRPMPDSLAYVDAPSKMCFLADPEGMVKFIDKLASLEKSKTPVFVVMRRVKMLKLNAVAVLLSVMVRFKNSGIRFTGDFPRDTSSKKLLIESKFFDHLRMNKERTEDRPEYSFPGASIFTHGQKSVEAALGAEIIDSVSQTVWGGRRRCPDLQRVFVELMLNTNNHASDGHSNAKHYWISVQHLKDEERVVFTFVDFGVGIFEHLRGKTITDKFFDVIAVWKKKELSNIEVLQKIFDGELYTSTKQYYRGKGLPGVYNAYKDNGISKLALITNDVFYNSSNESYETLERSFSGTLITWELNINNESIKPLT